MLWTIHESFFCKIILLIWVFISAFFSRSSKLVFKYANYRAIFVYFFNTLIVNILLKSNL